MVVKRLIGSPEQNQGWNDVSGDVKFLASSEINFVCTTCTLETDTSVSIQTYMYWEIYICVDTQKNSYFSWSVLLLKHVLHVLMYIDPCLGRWTCF